MEKKLCTSTHIEAANILKIDIDAYRYYLDLYDESEQEELKHRYMSDPNFKEQLDKLEEMIKAYHNCTLGEADSKAIKEAIDLDPTLAFCVQAILEWDYTYGELSKLGQTKVEREMKSDEKLRNEMRSAVAADIALSIYGFRHRENKKIQN